MSLKAVGVIDIPDSTDTLFGHGAFEPRSRRVFVAHTARNSIEVIDHDAGRHLSTLKGFPERPGFGSRSMVANPSHTFTPSQPDFVATPEYIRFACRTFI